MSVKVLSKKEGFAKTVCYLERGKSFGVSSVVKCWIGDDTFEVDVAAYIFNLTILSLINRRTRVRTLPTDAP